MRKTLVLLAATTVLLVACSSGSSGAGSMPVALVGLGANKGTANVTGSDVTIVVGDFSFSPTFIHTGQPGQTITVHVSNAGTLPHTFTSAVFGVNKTVSPGETVDLSVVLPATGAAEFHCRFHLQSNGMQGAFFFHDGDAFASASAVPSTSAASSSS